MSPPPRGRPPAAARGARPSSSKVAIRRRVPGGSRLAGATPRARGILVRDRGPGATACKVTQPWLRRGTAPDPGLRCSHGRKEVNDAPARLTTDPSCKDEARVGQQGTLTRVWARRGTRPRAPRDRRHAWACLFGAVRPGRAVGAALVLPYADTEAPGRDRAPRRARGARRGRARRGRVARRRGPRRPGEPRPPAAAALR